MGGGLKGKRKYSWPRDTLTHIPSSGLFLVGFPVSIYYSVNSRLYGLIRWLSMSMIWGETFLEKSTEHRDFTNTEWYARKYIYQSAKYGIHDLSKYLIVIYQ